MRQLTSCDSFVSEHYRNCADALREVAEWLDEQDESSTTVCVLSADMDDEAKYYVHVAVE